MTHAALVNSLDGRFEPTEVVVDDPIGDEVRIDVKASGLCHSDYLTATADRGLTLPILCGHEVAGVVTAVGPNTRHTSVGDHVTTCVAGACGACALCLGGRPWLCQGRAALQRPIDSGRPRVTRAQDPVTTLAAIGGFSEVVLTSERCLVTIDKGVPFDVASVLGCAVVTGMGAAINSACVSPGSTVAVIGCGGVGLNVIQGAKLCGASRVIAIDVSAEKLDRARMFGATDIINATDGPSDAQLLDLVPGGVDFTFEAVGSGKTAEQAVRMLARGGAAYFIGATANPAPLAGVTVGDLMMAGKSIHGVYVGSTRFTRDIPLYVDLYQRGRILLDDLVSEHISLDAITDSYAKHDDSTGARSVIVF